MHRSLVPMGPARTILDRIPASVTKAGRELSAIMVMLPLIHHIYKKTFFVMGISAYRNQQFCHCKVYSLSLLV